MLIAAFVHYYKTHNRAGGEEFLHSILRALAMEHDVFALTTDTAGYTTVVDGVRVFYKASNQSLAADFQWDWVVSHFARSNFSASLSRECDKPMILIVHNDFAATKKVAASLNQRDIVIYNTQYLAARVPTPARTIVIHPQADPNKIARGPDKDGYITLVNLIPEKGAGLFYDLARRYPNRKFLGVVGGYYPNKQMIVSMPNLVITPNTPDMRSIYERTRLLLMPSSHESFGMVAREAAGAGIPVLCTATPGLQENLGEAGTYLSCRDLDGYVREIERLDDPALYEAVSAKCRRRVEETETFEADAEKLLELVRQTKR